MNDWDYEESRERHRGPRFNKEKFCKKNRFVNGEYGFHSYERERCIYCGKIDPRVKFGHNRSGEMSYE